MKFYLAGAYNLKYYLRLVRDKLEELGHTVTSRWLNETERLDFKEDELPHEELGERAEHDIADIEEADCLLHFQLKSMPNLRGGAISEKGIAIAKGKLVGIVGDRINIFDYMDNVMLFASLDDLFKWAAMECGCNEKLDSLISKITPENVHEECQCGCGCKPTDAMIGVPSKIKTASEVAYASKPKCWCGKELHVDCDPDEFDRGGQITHSYYCLTHGQHYMEPQGIAISGKAASGKSTATKMLVEILGDPWHEESIIAPLKIEYFKERYTDRYATEQIADIVGEVNRLKNTDPQVRPDLIRLGQARRAVDPDYWLKQLPLGQGAIVSDTRFINEFNYLRSRGFFMVRIEANAEERRARGWGDINDSSETELDSQIDWDYVVNNNGSIDGLRLQAEDIAKAIQEAKGSI